jgi:hypothetical protein
LLRPFNRVILVVLFNAVPHVLMDGVITNQQLAPSAQPGASTLTVTGEDVSVMMDLEKKRAEHPAQNELIIAAKLIASYAQYGLIPMLQPPTAIDVPIPIERTPVQIGSDLEYLVEMASRFGYVFYIDPGPAPGTNTAYWGPPARIGLPQRALSVNMGPHTNVESLGFIYDALAPTIVQDAIHDARLGQTLPITTFASTRLPPLAAMPALPFQLPNVRKSLLEHSRLGQPPSYAQAFAQAQGATDKSLDNVVTAQGELDALRYGVLLKARALVGVRGVGFTYDGLYYVKSVTHNISKGQYKQRFTLTREGTGALTPVVIP